MCEDRIPHHVNTLMRMRAQKPVRLSQPIHFMREVCMVSNLNIYFVCGKIVFRIVLHSRIGKNNKLTP